MRFLGSKTQGNELRSLGNSLVWSIVLFTIEVSYSFNPIILVQMYEHNPLFEIKMEHA